MTWSIEVSDSVQFLCNDLITSPSIWSSFYFWYIYIKFFFYPKQANKCFTVGHTNAEFPGNSKVVDREIMISNSLEVQSLKCSEDRLLLSHLGLISTFINITGARYRRSHQGEWKLRIWWSVPVKSSAFFRLSGLTC